MAENGKEHNHVVDKGRARGDFSRTRRGVGRPARVILPGVSTP